RVSAAAVRGLGDDLRTDGADGVRAGLSPAREPDAAPSAEYAVAGARYDHGVALEDQDRNTLERAPQSVHERAAVARSDGDGARPRGTRALDRPVTVRVLHEQWSDFVLRVCRGQ